MSKRTLVLCSGGLDSVVLAKILDDPKRGGLLFVDYGQRSLIKEEPAVTAVAERLQMPLITVRVPGLFQGSCALVAGKTPDPGGKALAGSAAWVPARNLVLVALGVVQAVSLGYEELQIGNIGEGIYSDNKPEFAVRFNALLPWAVGPDNKVSITAPLNLLTKQEVVAVGQSFQTPFELSWSCFRNGDIHCGTCASCIGRRRAFDSVGIKDPVLYAE